MIDRPLFGAEHVRRYRETDGEEGYDWNGVHALLLATTGRKSGEERTNPLIFGRDGDNYVVVASKGGHPKHPAWYLNLSAQPEVGLQVKGERFRARARTAEAAERERLWQTMAEIWPQYDDYAKKTDREIPVVVLERI
jgi:deazaflavin-dependent oxidoreductase (nitroreductase family)